MKVIKKIMAIIGVIFAICFIIMSFALLRVNIKTKKMNDDYSSLLNNSQYNNAIMVENIEPIKQSISCGYATIEMFSMWNGNIITEEDLYNQYGKVVTSTGNSFCKEMNKQFIGYETTKYSYLTNTSLLKKIYDSLSKGVPVPIEWAAKYMEEWTLHYSLVIGIDLPSDNIIVANPYGYVENLSIDDFIERTSFRAYENMPFYFKLGFAFDLFEKNTIFIAKK